jgi:hypothetical protein
VVRLQREAEQFALVALARVEAGQLLDPVEGLPDRAEEEDDHQDSALELALGGDRNHLGDLERAARAAAGDELGDVAFGAVSLSALAAGSRHEIPTSIAAS